MSYDPYTYWKSRTRAALTGKRWRKRDMALDLLNPETVTFIRSHVRGRVLDAGCGFGRWSRVLAGCYGYYHGVDVVEDRIEYAAHTYGAPNVTFSLASGARRWNRLGIGPFDVAFSSNVIQHLPLDQALTMLESMASSVRSGGRIALWENIEPLDGHAPHMVPKALEELRRAVPGLKQVGRCRFVAELP